MAQCAAPWSFLHGALMAHGAPLGWSGGPFAADCEQRGRGPNFMTLWKSGSASMTPSAKEITEAVDAISPGIRAAVAAFGASASRSDPRNSNTKIRTSWTLPRRSFEAAAWAASLSYPVTRPRACKAISRQRGLSVRLWGTAGPRRPATK
jgi:hypothetical protein